MTKVIDFVKATGAAVRRLSAAQQPPVRFHTTQAPQPRVEPVRWHADTKSPGWIAYNALVHRPGAEKCVSAIQERLKPWSGYNVSFEEVAGLWQLWYEPRQGQESVSASNRYDEYHELKDANEKLGSAGRTPAHQKALNDFFDRLLRYGETDQLYEQERRLDKTTTAIVAHKPAAPMQSLQLRNGTEVWLRPLEGADAYQMDVFVRGLSATSFKTRFPAADRWDQVSGAEKIEELRSKLALQLTGRANVELGHAVQDAQGRILAHMDIKQMRVDGACEVDIVVCDELQGQGLGAKLFGESFGIAADAGYSRVRATVSDKNRRMLKLLAEYDFKQVENKFALPYHKSYEMELRKAAAGQVHLSCAPRSLPRAL